MSPGQNWHYSSTRCRQRFLDVLINKVLEAMSSMSSTFPSLSLTPMCIATYLMTWNIFQQLRGKWKTLVRQKCHTDSLSLCLHSTNRDKASSLRFGIGSEHLESWSEFPESFRRAEEQQNKAVLSGNWGVLLAREVPLQMIRDGMCSSTFFLRLWQILNSVQTERIEAKHVKYCMEAL